MSPSAGSFHVLLAKNLKILRLAVSKTARFVQSKVPSPTAGPASGLQPVFVRSAPSQPVHPAAFIRQSKRWFSSIPNFSPGARQFSSSKSYHISGSKYSRASLPKSKVATVISLSSGRAPFASTLRPNLTGGAIRRTAGGYSIGGGRIGGPRYFSHTPSSPAQVISQVNQAVRAFVIGGNKARFDGVSSHSRNARYKTVSALQHYTMERVSTFPKASPGSSIDFTVNPTITALHPLNTTNRYRFSKQSKDTLNSEGLLDVLSVDFARALKELAIVLNDLKRLSTLGDLPITFQDCCLRVHFPGCDSRTVERLADELGIQRGVIRQDDDFDAYNGTEIALLFPFAPSRNPSEFSLDKKQSESRAWWDDPNLIEDAPPPTPVMENLPTPDFSTLSNSGLELNLFDEIPLASSLSGYETIHSSDLELDNSFDYRCQSPLRSRANSLEYQGIEGIYRFIEQCDAASRR